MDTKDPAVLDAEGCWCCGVKGTGNDARPHKGLMVIDTAINELEGRALPKLLWSNLSCFENSQTRDPCGLGFCII